MRGIEGKEKLMNKVIQDVTNLEASPLYQMRKETGGQPVVGEGSLDAKIIFIGEAPGKNEAETGKPFCGASGKVLDKLLNSVNLKREEVYITSIVKDRPPKNRDPKPEEIDIYAPFMDKQIEIIKPKVIATLGRFGMEYIMRRYGLESKLASIGSLHGQVLETEIEGVKVKVVPLYHPAAAIYNNKLMETLFEDFKVLANLTK